MKRTTLLAISLAFTSFLVAVPGIRAATYYECNSVEQTQGKRETDKTNTKGWVDGNKSRVEFVSRNKSKDYPFAYDNYLVTTDGGATTYLVKPKEKIYGQFSMADFMATLGQMVNTLGQLGGMVTMEFSNPSSEKLLEEPGEMILGHATTHYRFKNQFTMSISVMGMKRESTNETITNIWTTTELSASGFNIWLRKDRGMQTGNKELDALVSEQMRSIKGIPLKVVSESKRADQKGRTQQSTTSMDVTVLRDEAVTDPNFFGWPADYTEGEVMPELERMKRMNEAVAQ
jgi:hypothetical protein